MIVVWGTISTYHVDIIPIPTQSGSSNGCQCTTQTMSCEDHAVVGMLLHGILDLSSQGIGYGLPGSHEAGMPLAAGADIVDISQTDDEIPDPVLY